ncbi:transmembrane protein, putative [Medicago truncatula]|uniref:Transmembrane protein, putative n=1 Tax=Medicago truncatula TaxID=3880 RepID=G7JGY5_MEDTR|nr:transmembrane protein, putative [Medicago truncatula]
MSSSAIIAANSSSCVAALVRVSSYTFAAIDIAVSICVSAGIYIAGCSLIGAATTMLVKQNGDNHMLETSHHSPVK